MRAKNLILLALTLLPAPVSCHDIPVIDAGGAAGAFATGGKSATGGAAIAGTPNETGGSIAATGGTQCAAVAMPDTPAPQPAAGIRKAPHPKLGLRHRRQPGRALATPVEASPTCSALHATNFKAPLNQVDGSCTGAALVDAISTEPFEGSAHHNIPDELAAYQGATCIDNGCSIPCTCGSCKHAYCPTTHANDTGSYGSSAAQWAVDVGWLPSYTTADTVPQLLACLVKSTATIGVDWRDSMWDPDAHGRIQVSLASPIKGGHDLEGLGLDMDPPDTHQPDVIVYNSWGRWGFCFKSQMTPATPTDGTGCGYARIAVSDLPKLNFDADCLQVSK